MPENPDTNPTDDQEIRGRLCAEVLGGYERWHSESDRRRAKRYYFESTANVEIEESEINGFLQWYVHDFRDAATRRTLMEHYFDTHGAQLTAREREILDALRDSWPGVFEAEAVEEGRGVQLRDLSSGETIFVHDVTASRELVRGDCMLEPKVHGVAVAEVGGRVKLIFVHEGEVVVPGQPIAKIESAVSAAHIVRSCHAVGRVGLLGNLGMDETYMCAMILSPNSEHLISVAPSIWRAKS